MRRRVRSSRAGGERCGCRAIITGGASETGRRRGCVECQRIRAGRTVGAGRSIGARVRAGRTAEWFPATGARADRVAIAADRLIHGTIIARRTGQACRNRGLVDERIVRARRAWHEFRAQGTIAARRTVLVVAETILRRTNARLTIESQIRFTGADAIIPVDDDR